MLLDLVEDPQRPQPPRSLAEIHDQGPAQFAPARNEQDQRCGEQQEFGKGRRQEFQCRLHPVDPGQMQCRERVGTAEHALQLLPEHERPVEHVQLVLQQPPELRKLAAPFHRGRGDQADHEGDPGAGGRHDQHGGDRARNAVALQETGGRRQHGADDEGHRDRQEERLGKIEARNDADDQQADEGDRHHFGAADDRRQFASAVGDRRAFVPVGKLAFTGQRFCRRGFGSQRLGGRRLGSRRLGSRRLGWHRLGGNDAHNGFPPPEAAIIGRRDLAIRTGITTWRRHASSNSGGATFVVMGKVAPQRRPNGTADPRARLLVQSIQ